MNHTKKISKLFWIILTIIPLLGIVFSIFTPLEFTQTQERLQSFIISFGVIAPIIFITVQALQVIITPINHYTIGFLGGLLYGPYVGALYNWIGRMIGHMIAFFLARYYGRRFMERFVEKETITKYDHYVNNKTPLLFLIYFLPLFPDDEISYLAGLSKIKTRMFILANIFGHIGGSLGLAYLGAGINTKDPLFWGLFITTIVGFPILWFYMKRKEAHIYKQS